MDIITHLFPKVNRYTVFFAFQQNSRIKCVAFGLYPSCTIIIYHYIRFCNIQSELKKLQARDKELDILFEKIYEDNAMGKISDDRFAKLSVKYEDEQKAVNEKMQNLKDEISNGKSKNVSTDMFIATVQKYTRAKKLTPQMLNELIDKIEVYQSEKIDGKTVQRLKIHYTCIGTLEIPDMDLIPENNVKIHTRQGVDVHFDTRACVAV